MARSRFVDLLEYLPLRLAVGIADALPITLSLAGGRMLGRLSWYLLPVRRRLATENVFNAGIAADRKEAARIAKASFLSFGMLAAESLAASRLITPETLDAHVELEIPEASRRLFEDPDAGIILASSHLGNWELSGHIISFTKKLVAVARRMNNPYAQAFMLKRNPRRNIEIVSKRSNERMALLRPLRNGQLLGLISDQHATSHGIMADFFGRPAKTVSSPARLHLLTKCPIICGNCIRTGPMQFKMIATEPLVYSATGDRDADILRITTDLNRQIEMLIRQYPEQYLWAHRRWR